MDLGNYGGNKHVTFGHMHNQFLLKALKIILGSRIPVTLPYSWNGEVKKCDGWYNLVFGHRFAAMDDVCSWNRSLTEPMVIHIILAKKSGNFLFNKVVLERWIIWFESQMSTVASEICGVSCKKLYKKLIILLRSVYSILRLLPAYEAFRKLSSLRKKCGFDIKYNVCSFSGPFSEPEELMKEYRFVPVVAEQGRFCLSVFYREDLSDFNMDDIVSNISNPLEIIIDYVDSPFPSSNKSSLTIQKVSRDAKQDSGWFSNFLYSSRLLRISRTLSFVDNFDDSLFSCPFIVDDTVPLDSRASLNLDGTNSSEVSLKTSSPSLRQDPRHNELKKKDGAASESKPFKLRKTSDALEELKLYRDMKDMILSKKAALDAMKNLKTEV